MKKKKKLYVSNFCFFGLFLVFWTEVLFSVFSTATESKFKTPLKQQRKMIKETLFVQGTKSVCLCLCVCV